MHTVHDRLPHWPDEKSQVPPDDDRLGQQVEQRPRYGARIRDVRESQQSINGGAHDQKRSRHEDAPQPASPRIIISGANQPVVRNHDDGQDKAGFLRRNRENPTDARQGGARATAENDRVSGEDHSREKPHPA
jgi:hypothetical protein